MKRKTGNELMPNEIEQGFFDKLTELDAKFKTGDMDAGVLAAPVLQEILGGESGHIPDDVSIALIAKALPSIPSTRNVLKVDQREAEYLKTMPKNRRLLWPTGVPLEFWRVVKETDGMLIGWARFEPAEKEDRFQVRNFVPVQKQQSKGLPPIIGCTKNASLFAREGLEFLVPHEKFVDLHADSAPLFFMKKRSKVEVLNFSDVRLKDAFVFLRDASDGDLDKIRKQDWVASSETWARLEKSGSVDPVFGFYRVIYGYWASFNNQGQKFAVLRKEREWWGPRFLSAFRERLSGVKLVVEDPEVLLRRQGPQSLVVLHPTTPFRASTKFKNTLKTTSAKVLLINGDVGEPEGYETIGIEQKDARGFSSSASISWNFVVESMSTTKTPTSPELDTLSVGGIEKMHDSVHEEWRGRGSRVEDDQASSAHEAVVHEMQKRGLEHRDEDSLDAVLLSSCGIREANILLALQESLTLSDPFIFVTEAHSIEKGMEKSNDSDGDLDVWVDAAPESALFTQVASRIKSNLPEEMRSRVRVVSLEKGQPIGRIPLARLRVELLPETRQHLTTTSKGAGLSWPSLSGVLATSITAPMGIVAPLRVRGGYQGGRAYTLDALAKRLDEEGWPYLVEANYQGVRVQLHCDGRVARIFSEKGKNITDRFPRMVAALEAARKSLIFDGVCVGEGMERRDVLDYVESKSSSDDSPFTFFCFDCVHAEGQDLHSKPLRVRKSALGAGIKGLRKDGDNLIEEAPFSPSRNEEELRIHVDHFSNVPHSDGIMVKAYESAYSLDGVTTDWFSLSNQISLDVEVVGRNKDQDGIWQYACVVHGQGDHPILVGELHDEKGISVGDIIRVGFLDLHKLIDPDTGIVWFNWVLPEFVEKREKESRVDSAQTTESIHKDTNGKLEELAVPKRFQEVAEVEEFKKGQHPRDWGVIQAHFQGSSVHYDFRRKLGGYLNGETLMVQPPDLTISPVTTVAQAKAVIKKYENRWKFRPDMGPSEKVTGIPKSRHPLEWLDAAPGVILSGKEGATEKHPGVFVPVDSGYVYPGVQKSHFKEFFLDMRKFKGRMTETLIGFKEDGKEKAQKKRLVWLVGMAASNEESQRPYLLSRRGRTYHDYVPPDGISALPPSWENKIPKQFRWWVEKMSRKDKLDRMDLAYNWLIEHKKMSGRMVQVRKSTAKFALRVLRPKEQKMTSDPTPRYDLLIDDGSRDITRIMFKEDPLEHSSMQIIMTTLSHKTPDGKPPFGWLKYKGELSIGADRCTDSPFGSSPTTVSIVDSGVLEVLIKDDYAWMMEFKGKSLKGHWMITMNPGTLNWIFEKITSPFEGTSVQFIEKNVEQKFVLGPVLLPEVVDAQGDIMSAEVIETACHEFMLSQGVIGVQHREFNRRLSIVENYVTRVPLNIGGRELPKGTWMLGVKVLDDEIWKAIKSGELTGFSFGGWGISRGE